VKVRRVLTTDVPRLELKPDELARATQDNLFALFRSLAQLPGGDLEELGRLSRHFAPPSNPMFKSVWNCRLEPNELQAAITNAEAWFEARDAPFAFWWLGPDTEPDGMRAALEAAGWEALDVDAPCMEVELDALDRTSLEQLPESFEIELVRDEAELETWARTFVAAFEVPEWAGAAWVDATRTFGVDSAPWALYLGKLEHEPVATTILYPGAGVVQAFGVGTLAPARRRGIGAAITLAAYRDARELGYRYGVLFSSAAGRPVYRRLGFTESGATITRYLWVRA
jgi:GNAT superfamily N-acetyltransferase